MTVPGDTGRYVFHRLEQEGLAPKVLEEEKVSRVDLLRGRYKRLGLVPVAGQLAFIAGVQPLLARLSAGRARDIEERFGLDGRPIPGSKVTRVSSVNADDARAALVRLAPRVVVLAGTRIVGKKTLSSVPATFLNMHAGITPRYRGVHGGYWALADGRPDLVGTTVHLVDTGIDTGAVVEQVTFRPDDEDGFATLPLLHTAHGLPALVRAVRAALDGTLRTVPPLDASTSKLRYHPTVLEYLGAARRVR